MIKLKQIDGFLGKNQKVLEVCRADSPKGREYIITADRELWSFLCSCNAVTVFVFNLQLPKKQVVCEVAIARLEPAMVIFPVLADIRPDIKDVSYRLAIFPDQATRADITCGTPVPSTQLIVGGMSSVYFRVKDDKLNPPAVPIPGTVETPLEIRDILCSNYLLNHG